MSLQVFYTPQARETLASVYNFIDTHFGLSVAEKFLLKTERTINLISFIHSCLNQAHLKKVSGLVQSVSKLQYFIVFMINLYNYCFFGTTGKNLFINTFVFNSKIGHWHSLEFYLNRPLILVNEDGKGNLPKKPFLLYASEASINQLKQKGWKIKLIKTFDDYLVTRLKGKFLNWKTRKEMITQMQLVMVQEK